MTPVRFETAFIRFICSAMAMVMFYVLIDNADLHVRLRLENWALIGIQFFAIIGLFTCTLSVANFLTKLNRPIVERD